MSKVKLVRKSIRNFRRSPGSMAALSIPSPAASSPVWLRREHPDMEAVPSAWVSSRQLSLGSSPAASAWVVGGRAANPRLSALLSSPPRPLSGPRSSAALAERPGSEAAATVSIPWLERRGGHGLGEGRAQGPTECPAMSIPSGTREIAFDPPPSILRRTHTQHHAAPLVIRHMYCRRYLLSPSHDA